MKKVIQQGDVLFVRIKKLPQGNPVEPKNGRYVLVEGEATGHCHVVKSSPKVKVVENKGQLFLQTFIPALITHEEHKTVVLPPGVFKVRRVNEWDYDKEQARKIQD